MKGRFLTTSANSIKVYDRPKYSHLHDNVEKMLIEALKGVSLNKHIEKQVFNFNKEIGYQLCIPTNEEDIISGRVYLAKRGGRGWKSRMIKDKDPIKSNQLTCVLKKRTQGDESFYKVLTAYIGSPAPKEPSDPSIKTEQERAKSVFFWSNHALIDESSIVCML